MQQVADADPRNAAFHLDLSNIEMTFAYFLVRMDKTEWLEHASRAVAIQDEQAKSQPGNPDFMAQTAAFHTGIGRLLVWRQDYDSAVAHHRQAESIYRDLAHSYTDERFYLKRLAGQMSLIGDALISTPNRAEALSNYQKSIALWEKLAGHSGREGDCLIGLGQAHASLAKALVTAGRQDEALAQDQAAIMAFDRAVATAATPDEARGNAAGVDFDLSTIYSSRHAGKSSLEALLHAAPFIEADYAAHPEQKGTVSALVELYERLEGTYAALNRNEEALAPG